MEMNQAYQEGDYVVGDRIHIEANTLRILAIEDGQVTFEIETSEVVEVKAEDSFSTLS